MKSFVITLAVLSFAGVAFASTPSRSATVDYLRIRDTAIERLNATLPPEEQEAVRLIEQDYMRFKTFSRGTHIFPTVFSTELRRCDRA